MKANAPEKLYFFEGETILSARSKKIEDANIEYVRTDAFIEKAQLFLIDKLNETSMGSGKMKIKAECSLDEFIEDFRKYMKGE